VLPKRNATQIAHHMTLFVGVITPDLCIVYLTVDVLEYTTVGCWYMCAGDLKTLVEVQTTLPPPQVIDAATLPGIPTGNPACSQPHRYNGSSDRTNPLCEVTLKCLFSGWNA
jgi:hypothetical protein